MGKRKGKRKRSASVFADFKKWQKEGGTWHGALPSFVPSKGKGKGTTSGKRGVDTPENKTRWRSPSL